MKFRPALKTDELFIRQVYKDCKNEIGSFNLYNCWDDYLIQKTPYKFYVLENIGMIRFGFSKKINAFVVKDFGIVSEKQRCGYGQLFFQNLPRPVYLTCNTDNEKGNSFYKKMGMKFIGTKLSKNKKKKMNIWVM
jgi:hypothetical protein